MIYSHDRFAYEKARVLKCNSGEESAAQGRAALAVALKLPICAWLSFRHIVKRSLLRIGTACGRAPLPPSGEQGSWLGA